MNIEKLQFGIYPGGAAGGDNGLLPGRPENPTLANQRLAELQGAGPLVVRVYEAFGTGLLHPAEPLAYLAPRRTLDLVLAYQSKQGDVEGYLAFVERRLRALGPLCSSVQLAEEPNFTHGPDCIDGPQPRVLEAVARAVPLARRVLDELGLPHVPAGFNSTPTFGASASFWADLAAHARPDFLPALGYVGFDFFPDVFHPAPDPAAATAMLLETLRQQWLPQAGIAAQIPIHIAEHGWPTGAQRPEARQAEVLEAVVRETARLAAELNIRRYTAFSLRDADSSQSADMFSNFGLTRDDYSPKPAFDTYRRLIAEFGATAAAPRPDCRPNAPDAP